MTRTPVFALVDCNNFFVSCERLFRPDIENKPVVVLSSNDGCVVARSNEAKALGIPMGAPAFKYRELFQRHSVVQFSANFELYGDISRRITQLLTSFTPRTEIYSIDEVFLDLSELADTNYETLMQNVRDRIRREIGVPVSIGIAPTKTLAKLASDCAKKQLELTSILSLTTKNTPQYLTATAIENIWGIGRRLAPKLRGEGLATALELSMLSTRRARQLMGVKGEQTVRELRGQACFGLETIGRRPKSIARTRTFGEDTGKQYVLESAIANFATQAAWRLRASNQLTRRAGLFLMTNRHKPGFKSWSSEILFQTPVADTGKLSSALIAALDSIFQTGQQYHRAGVWLHDFVDDAQLQTDLLGTVDTTSHDSAVRRMQAVDSINKRFGRGTLHFAAEDLAHSWEPQRKLRSPHYTSDWDQLPTVEP